MREEFDEIGFERSRNYFRKRYWLGLQNRSYNPWDALRDLSVLCAFLESRDMLADAYKSAGKSLSHYSDREISVRLQNLKKL